MCFQNDDFNDMSLHLGNLRQRVSSRQVGPRQDNSMRLLLHESRIDELEYEGADYVEDSQVTEQAAAVGNVDD